MQGVIKVIHRITYYVSLVGMVFLLLMMLLTVADVIGRSIFNSPVTGTYEITAYMLVIIVLFGIAYTEQRGGNIRVELFSEKLPALGQLILYAIFTLMALCYFAFVVWQGWLEGFVGMRVGTSSDILHIPAYPFQFIIPFGAFLICLELALNLIPSEKRRKEQEKEVEMSG